MQNEFSHILIVDDDKNNADMLSDLIEINRQDLIIRKEYTYDDAINYLKQNIPLMIISDNNLDKTYTGLDIFKFMNEKENDYGSVIRVFMSGIMDDDLISRGEQYGADVCICKPIQLDSNWDYVVELISMMQ